MLEAVGRAWQTWRDKRRLIAPLLAFQSGRVFAHDLLFPELRPVRDAGGPELEPYRGLADAWDWYNSAQLPDYPSYLTALARRRGLVLRSVLDVACGTGLLSFRLGSAVEEVIGLDASEPMLTVARGRQRGTFVRGDFRDFNLGRQFNAAVCASNSLNYVADRGDLGRAFAAVGRHLRPGGVFVFDTSTERLMRLLSGLYLHVEQAGGRRFVLQFNYDAERRRETSRAILPAGVETHRRIPLDPADVIAAAKGSGLEVEDYFSSALWPRGWGHGTFCFFVLVKRS